MSSTTTLEPIPVSCHNVSLASEHSFRATFAHFTPLPMVSTIFVNSPTENHTAYLITYSDSSAHAVQSTMAQAFRAPAIHARLSNAIRPAHNADEAGGCAKGDAGGSKKRKKGKDSNEKDEMRGFSTGGGSSKSAASRAETKSRSYRQTQAESRRKPTARHHQKSPETPAPQQDFQKEGLQTRGNLISDTESDAPANARNRGKRMLDDSDDHQLPRGAEEGSGRTVKMPKISQPGDSEQRRSHEVIMISDDES